MYLVECFAILLQNARMRKTFTPHEDLTLDSPVYSEMDYSQADLTVDCTVTFIGNA